MDQPVRPDVSDQRPEAVQAAGSSDDISVDEGDYRSIASSELEFESDGSESSADSMEGMSALTDADQRRQSAGLMSISINEGGAQSDTSQGIKVLDLTELSVEPQDPAVLQKVCHYSLN